jgi:hypothetical protein
MSIAILFFAAYILMLVTAAIISALGRRFMTHRYTDRAFDIIDLEFPVNAKEMQTVINGIYRLSPEKSESSSRALKTQLLIDFLFMPAAYGTVFLMCWVAAHYVPAWWSAFFQAIAWVQLLALLCDVCENIFLLNHIHPYEEKDSIKNYRLYQFFVYTKWLTVLIGVVCGCAGFAYLLFSGAFPTRWYFYLLAVMVAAILGIIASSHKRK